MYVKPAVVLRLFLEKEFPPNIYTYYYYNLHVFLHNTYLIYRSYIYISDIDHIEKKKSRFE